MRVLSVARNLVRRTVPYAAAPFVGAPLMFFMAAATFTGAKGAGKTTSAAAAGGTSGPTDGWAGILTDAERKMFDPAASAFPLIESIISGTARLPADISARLEEASQRKPSAKKIKVGPDAVLRFIFENTVINPERAANLVGNALTSDEGVFYRRFTLLSTVHQPLRWGEPRLDLRFDLLTDGDLRDLARYINKQPQTQRDEILVYVDTYAPLPVREKLRDKLDPKRMLATALPEAPPEVREALYDLIVAEMGDDLRKLVEHDAKLERIVKALADANRRLAEDNRRLTHDPRGGQAQEVARLRAELARLRSELAAAQKIVKFSGEPPDIDIGGKTVPTPASAPTRVSRWSVLGRLGRRASVGGGSDLSPDRVTLSRGAKAGRGIGITAQALLTVAFAPIIGAALLPVAAPLIGVLAIGVVVSLIPAAAIYFIFIRKPSSPITFDSRGGGEPPDPITRILAANYDDSFDGLRGAVNDLRFLLLYNKESLPPDLQPRVTVKIGELHTALQTRWQDQKLFVAADDSSGIEKHYVIFPNSDAPGGKWLGRGGMAQVYEAVDLEDGKLVAVKVNAHPDDPALSERFERESKAMMAIDRPDVVKVLARRGSKLFVMEYLAAPSWQTLDDNLRTARPTPELAVAITVKICEAMMGIGLHHRDLKPANVFIKIGPTGTEIKISDFGLAKLPSDDASQTSTGIMVGTHPYMAPYFAAEYAQIARAERSEAVVAEVLTKNDIYAIGVILYRMLTGHYLTWEREGRLVSVSGTAGPDAVTLTDVITDYAGWKAARDAGNHAEAARIKAKYHVAKAFPAGGIMISDQLYEVLEKMTSFDPAGLPADFLAVKQALERALQPQQRAGDKSLADRVREHDRGLGVVVVGAAPSSVKLFVPSDSALSGAFNAMALSVSDVSRPVTPSQIVEVRSFLGGTKDDVAGDLDDVLYGNVAIQDKRKVMRRLTEIGTEHPELADIADGVLNYLTKG